MMVSDVIQRLAFLLYGSLFLHRVSFGHAFTIATMKNFRAPQVSQKQPLPLSFLSRQSRKQTSSSRLPMCICIDCARVTNCEAYHFVETKHEQPHIHDGIPDFTPRDGSPTIHVNVRTVRTKDGQEEFDRMWREHEGETAKAEAQAAGGLESNELHGETVYDLTPVTTYEYDVVACEDFVEDKGCWVRNMPEEIKKANPNFVPT